MTLTLDDNNATYQIKSYEPGSIRVNDQTYTESIIVAPDKIIEHWQPQSLPELTDKHLAVIAELKPAILLIGTGSELQFPNIEIYGELINLGIGVEIMNTGAACRTYNALTSEGRNVIAALIIK